MQQLTILRLVLVVIFAFLGHVVLAQQNNSIQFGSIADSLSLDNDTGQVVIRNIFISGNRKTKSYIILREMTFKEGDRVPVEELISRVERSRENIYNTRLFLEVVPHIKNWVNNEVDIYFVLKERWYFFPLPYFRLIDRNLNQWLVEQNASLKRVNYGLRFAWNNVSGRNDKLRVNLVSGYTRLYDVSYEQPFADKKLKHGFGFGFSFSQNRQINLLTENNKQIFFPATNEGIVSDIIRREIRFDLSYSYRPDLYRRHNFRFVFVDQKISDTIIKLNANYFLYGRATQVFPELSYSFENTNVDSVAYPLRGVSYNWSLTQRGLGISRGMNYWELSAGISRYLTIAGKNHFSVQVLGKIKLPFTQPYYNLRALGFGEFFLRGLENYIVDGVASAVTKFTYRRRLFQFSIPTIRYKGSVYRMPVKIYAKAYSDWGYSYLKNPGNNPLNNKLIYTSGFGLDIITIYDFQLKLEFSFNQLRQNGLFLHTQND
ncbi:MAG TPA: BamA/TamA family outer membrane protein [Chitinophagaceae bacterium]|nr:BamA/TamA family outer membrane protein [Chitinophagaceae bacterium]